MSIVNGMKQLATTSNKTPTTDFEEMPEDNQKIASTEQESVSYWSILRGYGEWTTFHGLPNATSVDTGRRLRLFWTIAFCIGIALVSAQLYILISRYFLYEKTVEQELRFEPMPFPAVTLCSLNPFVAAKALAVPEIQDLAAAYNNAMDELHSSQQGNKGRKGRKSDSRKKRSEVGGNELIGKVCFHEKEKHFFVPEDLYQRSYGIDKSKAVRAECLCVNDQWDFVSYCAPYSYWTYMSCNVTACSADHYCGAYLDSMPKEKAQLEPSEFEPCWCNVLHDGCYRSIALTITIPPTMNYLTTTVVGSTTTPLVVTTTTPLHDVQHTTTISSTNSTTDHSNVTVGTVENSVTTGSVRVLLGTTTTDRTINDRYQQLPLRRRRRLADYSTFFNNITDEMAMQAAAKETLVYISGSMSDEQKKQITYDNDGEFIRMCSFNGRQCDRKRDFRRILDPIYGSCFTFNYDWVNPKVCTRAGATYGLKVMLYADVTSSYLFSSDSPGVRVAIHRQAAQPFPEVFGSSAPNGFISSFAVHLKQISRLPPPHGNCVKVAADNDNYLYPGDYSVEGCYRSCYQSKVVQRCGCADPRFPALPGVPTCKSDHIPSRRCVSLATRDLGNMGEIEKCSCKPPCFDNVYSASFSGSLYPTMTLKIAGCTPPNNKTCLKRFSENAAVVEIYYQQLNFILLTETPKYSSTNLLSDIGGTMGLYLGASLLTLMELVALCGHLGQIVLRRLMHRIGCKTSPLFICCGSSGCHDDDGDIENQSECYRRRTSEFPLQQKHTGGLKDL